MVAGTRTEDEKRIAAEAAAELVAAAERATSAARSPNDVTM
jgi:hypothetical protein